MKTVPATPAGPVDDVRRADAHARAALAEAVARTAQLWRSIADSAVPVPGLTWTAGQTAAHMVADMREYTEALTRYVNGDDAAINIPDGSPARARTAVNDQHLINVSERDLHRLADMLEEAATRYLAVASAIDTAAGAFDFEPRLARGSGARAEIVQHASQKQSIGFVVRARAHALVGGDELTEQVAAHAVVEH